MSYIALNQNIKYIAGFIAIEFHRMRMEYLHLDKETAGLTVPHLHKLLYYLQAWHMVQFGRDKLVFEEAPSSRCGGPVYDTIIDVFKGVDPYIPLKGEDEIKLFQPEYKGVPTYEIDEFIEKNLRLSADQILFLDWFFDYHKTMSYDRLVFMTHCDEPWSETRSKSNPFKDSDKKISLDTMYEYYTDMLKGKLRGRY